MENSNLIKKMRIRPSLFVVTVCLSSLVLELVALGLLVGYEASLGLLEPKRLGWIACGLVAQLLMTLVPALLVAILAAFLRDLVLLLPFLMAATFYLSPVVYPAELAPSYLAPILNSNPVAWVLQFYRAGLIGGGPPSLESIVFGFPLLIVLALSLAWSADRLRPHLADIL